MKRVVLLLILMAFSCTKKSGPEQALRDFVNYRLSSGQSRSGLLDKTSGALNETISAMDDKEFKKFINIKKLKKKKMSLNIKNCELNNKCFLTYTLSYNVLDDGKKAHSVEVKKIAELTSPSEGIWKVANVNNVKTFIDSKEELGISADGPAKVPAR